MSLSVDSAGALASLSQTTSSTTQTTGADASSFQDILNSILEPDEDSMVNEEQLFAAIIQERLTTQVGEDSANTFSELFATYRQELQREDGYIPIEEAAEKALNGLVDQGMLDQGEADDLHSLAFQAAQLDDDAAYLHDSIGSTMAVMLVNLAIGSAEEEINAINTGADSKSSETTGVAATEKSDTTQGTFVGGDGFLYKPTSESNGNLVILLPTSMEGNVDSTELVDSMGNILETGDSYGTYDDGRPIFRFNSAGVDYPDSLTVRINLDTGDYNEYFIPDSSSRYE